DPLGDYLDPPLRGYRLRKGVYQPIRLVNGRLPSQVLGLHLERDGKQLRLYDPSTQQWLPTLEEDRLAREQDRLARQQAEAEIERLRRENEELRRRMSEGK